MSPVPLIALKKFGPYPPNGRSYEPGETFEARDEADAATLVLFSLASRAESSAESTPEPVQQPAPSEPVIHARPEQESEPAYVPVVENDEPVEDESEPDEPSTEPMTTESALVDAPRRRRGSYRRRDMKAED